MQYIGDERTIIWFPIPTLHVCGAVKALPSVNPVNGEVTRKFVAIDKREAQESNHPPMFACIMRRTKGKKVLECHCFVTKSDQNAMTLVQAMTHAYNHKEAWNTDLPPIGPKNHDRQNIHLVEADRYRGNDSREMDDYYNIPKGPHVKNYQVYGGGNIYGMLPFTSGAPPMMLPPPQDPVLVGPPPPLGPPFIPGLPPFVMPPKYFADWNQYGGQPLFFPPPEDTYGFMKKRESRSKKRGKPRKPDKHHVMSLDRERSRRRSPSPRYHSYSSSEDEDDRPRRPRSLSPPFTYALLPQGRQPNSSPHDQDIYDDVNIYNNYYNFGNVKHIMSKRPPKHHHH